MVIKNNAKISVFAFNYLPVLVLKNQQIHISNFSNCRNWK